MSGKAIHFASVWSCLAHGGWRWIVPQRVNWWRGENLQGGKSSVFYLPVLFEGDVSWQCRRGLKINVAKGGSDSLSAGAVLLGGPIGLGCHFCYLILCMWTRQIQRGGGSAGQQQERQTEENARMLPLQLPAAHDVLKCYFQFLKFDS